jgi:hypothetical protein
MKLWGAGSNSTAYVVQTWNETFAVGTTNL